MTDVQPVLEEALDAGVLDDAVPWAIFFDLDELDDRFARLQRSFPADALHAVAVKANPLVAVLQRLVEHGAGLEAASTAEIEIARRANAVADQIVFDSPAKTVSDLRAAMEAGIHINADNNQELERIDGLQPPDGASIGLRLNPVVGKGSIDATAVSGKNSKFGVSLLRNHRALIDAFRRYPWLRGLHVHTGSQGYGLDLLVEGVRRCVDFALELDRRFGPGRTDTIDIGGGLPVAYRPHVEPLGIEDYAAALRREVPELFERRWRLITEFGRWLHAPCAFAASRVEYVKDSPGGPIATIHFGADLLVRTAYRPQDWYHRLTIYDGVAAHRQGDEVDLTVAGPLCFSGDLICRRRRLPRPRPGDLVVVHDVGAYTFSMWSRYCSRPFPRIIGFREDRHSIEFVTLHGGESEGEVASFWEH